MSYTGYVNGDVVPLKMLCANRTRLQSCWWFHCPLLLVQLLASRALSRGQSAHPLLWQTCKMLCSWALFCDTMVYNGLKHEIWVFMEAYSIVLFKCLAFLLYCTSCVFVTSLLREFTNCLVYYMDSEVVVITDVRKSSRFLTQLQLHDQQCN